ncbi:MAG: CCE_0567 family metalloprotein [Pseudomonadota bacterium]|uniref:CCE_0567 family metalloprotein n=1 Tax=Novosphingobium sp. MBES04 TaxID=1206458 RepID=UPI0005807BD1|nr:CCE_0567 family metalloprotein [Novosphingobium sp. MBES04]MED5546840.1 CCE_0567 family metalloprotein [Pseudomonadota bacterium]
MSDLEAMKAEVKKLSARAMQAKMDLHDLSEELPVGLENVMATASRVCESYAALAAKKAEMKALESAS